MKKQDLIDRLQATTAHDITLTHLFDYYVDFNLNEFMVELKAKVEEIFEIDELDKKTRNTEYIAARASFFYLAEKKGIKVTVASKYLSMTHSTAINSRKQFEVYQRYYLEYKQKIKDLLSWYSENHF